MSIYRSKKFQAMTEEQITAYFDQLWADNEIQDFYDTASETEMIDFENWSMGQPAEKPKLASVGLNELLNYFDDDEQAA